jgi:galactokinase
VQSVEDINNAFKRAFGTLPEVVAQAPGRVNLIGEHIDYSDGFVLPFAIKYHTTVGVRRNNSSVFRFTSAQKPEEVIELSALAPMQGETWGRYVAGVIWALDIKEGLDIYVDGQVPVGAGLSSSAALECSTAVALNQLFKLGKSKTDLARITQRAENDFVGVPCGIMDQSVSLMAHEGSALLLDCRDLSTRDIPFDIASHGLELLIIDTQVHHELVDGGYAERRASCEKAVEVLGITSLRDISVDEYSSRKSELDTVTYIRGFHAVTEMKRVLDTVDALSAQDFERVGALISGSHASLRDDYTVSCPELDLAVKVALDCGALGARMVGGGFGGSAIALAKVELISAIQGAIVSQMKAAGFPEPRFFTSLPAEGAKVL